MFDILLNLFVLTEYRAKALEQLFMQYVLNFNSPKLDFFAYLLKVKFIYSVFYDLF